MRHIKKFETLTSIDIEKTQPEYYTEQYRDDETFTGVVRLGKGEYRNNKYTGKEFRELFMLWYNRIEKCLDNDDEFEAAKILSNWDEECLAKFDLYILVKKHFDIKKITNRYNL